MSRNKQSFREFVRLVKSDLKRYHKPFWFSVFFIAGFKYTFNHRLCYYLSQHKMLLPLSFLQRLYLHHITYLLGIEMGRDFNIPEGFVIAHFGGITFYPKSCGKCCFLRPGVTVGTNDNYDINKKPQLGSYVKFGVNSSVLGGVKVGNNVIIGAGAVVTKDVPDNCIVGGVPAKIIRYLRPEEIHSL